MCESDYDRWKTTDPADRPEKPVRDEDRDRERRIDLERESDRNVSAAVQMGRAFDSIMRTGFPSLFVVSDKGA